MKTTEKQFEISRTPCGNYAIATPRGYLATRHGDYWREKGTAPVHPAVYHSQATCQETLADYSRFLSDLAKRREEQAGEAEKHFARLFGGAQWSEKARDRVLELRTLASDAWEESLIAWQAAGKQARHWKGA